jgi:cell fate (sporulation/competence/biofilm development) regulator YlbF (YheA/YmcA/DUF963 family)
MESTIEESVVMQKTKDLCQAILDEPAVQSILTRIQTFMGDEKTRAQYEDLVSKGQSLQEKQQNSVPLTGEEIAGFEQDRDALLGNPVARGFLDAQEEMRTMQQSIQRYVNKTFELGRLPTEEDVATCGHGCNCGH